jgi:hypothetical protein
MHAFSAIGATLAMINERMRLNFFAHRETPEPNQPPAGPLSPPPLTPPSAGPVRQPRTGKAFAADEVVWGIVIRHGFDEMDDPWYHRGVTQHAYLEGHDSVAICGFRPPLSGSRTHRRPRLGLPSTGEHPMCGMCARMVVAPRPRVPVPIQPFRPAVVMPVAAGVAPLPTVAPRAVMAPATPQAQPAPGTPVTVNAGASLAGGTTSPWVRRYAGSAEPQAQSLAVPGGHDAGLLARGVHLDETEH